MPEDNITSQATQPQDATPAVDAQAPATEQQQVPVEPVATPVSEAKPVIPSFSQKIELTQKKYEYINGKGMDAVAAEEAARKDLGLPPMNETEKTKSGKKNIFEKILDFLGLNKKLESKPEEDKPAEATSVPAQPAEQSAEPEVKPAENAAPAEASENPAPQNTENQNPPAPQA